MIKKNILTLEDFIKHIQADWRTAHGIWKHVRDIAGIDAYTKAEIDAFFEGESPGGKKQVDWNNILNTPSPTEPFPDYHFHRKIGTEDLERWYLGWHVRFSTLGTGTPTVNTIIALPIIVPKDTNIDRIGFRVTTSAATSLYDFSLYDDVNLYPTNLLSSYGTLATTTTGFKSLNIDQDLIGGKIYWLATWIKGGPTVLCPTASNKMGLLGYSSTLTTTEHPGCGYILPKVYDGVWPDPFPTIAEGTIVSTTVDTHPAISMRFTI